MGCPYGRSIAIPLVFLNFCLYAVVVCIAGWAFNTAINHPVESWTVLAANAATPYFVLFSLIAGIVGIAAKFSAGHHLRGWHNPNVAPVAVSIALAAWLFTLVAMGLACKEIHLGHVYYKRMKVLEAFVIILSGTQLLYVIIALLECCDKKECNTRQGEGAKEGV